MTVDLQARANQALSEGPGEGGNNLDQLQKGKQSFEGTEFQIDEKMIHLRGLNAPDWPEKVTGINVGWALQSLRFLHANQQGFREITEVGAYVIHYSDGTEVRITLKFGENIANWFWPSQRKKGDAATAAVVAWKGQRGLDPESRSRTSPLLHVLDEPAPEKIVDTIDSESKNTLCDLFLVALTLETK